MNELKKSKGRDLLLKTALLCCTIIVSATAAINGNISEIAKAFPGVQLSTVELISTIPSLFLMISVLTSRNIAKAIGYKKTVLIGIGIDVICGVIPMVISNIYVILISRALFGFGVGMFNSLMVALICYFYDGNERSTMIGLQGTIGGLGGLVVTFISGQLLKIALKLEHVFFNLTKNNSHFVFGAGRTNKII
jgi:MFS family permease